jgi:hypothetical protein
VVDDATGRVWDPNRHLQCPHDELCSQMLRHRPADHPATKGIEDHRQGQEILGGRDRGDVNGLLTNDKFCLTRPGRLHLSWSRVEVWQRRVAAQASTRQDPHLPCSPGEDTRRGGQDETSMAYSPVVRHTAGRPSPLGPRLSAPVAVEPPSAPAAPHESGPTRGPGSAGWSGGDPCA